MTKTTRTIPAGEFKARCLKLMDEVAATGEEIVVTKRGKPVAKLVRAETVAPRKFEFGYMKDTFDIVGDIVGPTLPNYKGTERWDRLAKQLAEGKKVKGERRKRA
jgi:prevent-host-death family protein